MVISTWNQVTFWKTEENQSTTFFFIKVINKTFHVFLFPERFIFSWVVWSVSQCSKSFNFLFMYFASLKLQISYLMEAFPWMTEGSICDKSVVEQWKKMLAKKVLALESLKISTNCIFQNLLSCQQLHGYISFICLFISLGHTSVLGT